MKRRLLRATLLLVLLGLIAAWAALKPPATVEYQDVVFDCGAPPALDSLNTSLDIKVRLLVYKNGELVVNKTDPPTYNFYQLARFALGWTWYNGTKPRLRLLTVSGTFYEGRVRGGSYVFGVQRYGALIGSGYHEPGLYVANVSEPVKYADVMMYKLSGSKLLLLATYLFNETVYVQEVGWYVKVWQSYYGSYTYGPVTVMLVYETFDGFWVDPGDNVTVVWVFEFPTQEFASVMQKWFWGGTNLKFGDTRAQLELYFNVSGEEKTQSIGCINQLYTNVEPPRIVLVCSGFSDYTGNLTRICVSPGAGYTCTVDIRPREPVEVRTDDPITFVLTLTTR